MGPVFMKKHIQSILLVFAGIPSLLADDGLPTLQRVTLDNETLWRLETELVGHRERNGAVLECMAAALSDLLQQAGHEATVEKLVQVLTTPSEHGTPESAIKELLLPRADIIQVSMDGSFAIIATQSRNGEALEIFRDTVYGLSVQRLRR